MGEIIWAGFSMTLFAAIITATKRNQSTSDKILSAWLFLMAIDFANLGIHSNLTDGFFIPSTFLLFNPAFYLYTRSLTDSKFSLRWIQILHLLPYIFLELIKLIFPLELNVYSFFDADTTLWLRLLFAISLIASILIYNIMSVQMVHRHRMNLKNIFSTIEVNHRITWLLFILVIYMVYVFSTTLWGIIGFVQSNFDPVSLYNYIWSLVLTCILGFYGIKQEAIFPGHRSKSQSIEKKYPQSNLSKDLKQDIKAKLIDYMENDKAFLNSDLNMPMLAEAFQIPKYQITEVLNTELGKNFFLFVNEYRIHAVKKMLKDPENDKYSIESLAYDCGFNSKSTFFAVFKSFVKQTPLQYRKTARMNSNPSQ
jgi:AraC-like DNA-binding protein